MAKEPWEEDIYDDGEETLKRTSKLNGIKADRSIDDFSHYFLCSSSGDGLLVDFPFNRWQQQIKTNVWFLQWRD